MSNEEADFLDNDLADMEKRSQTQGDWSPFDKRVVHELLKRRSNLPAHLRITRR